MQNGSFKTKVTPKYRVDLRNWDIRAQADLDDPITGLADHQEGQQKYWAAAKKLARTAGRQYYKDRDNQTWAERRRNILKPWRKPTDGNYSPHDASKDD